MKESDFCRKVVTPWLKERSIYYFKPRGGPYSTRKGIPDYILCISGRFVGLEAKTEKGTLTEWQEEERKRIKSAGGIHIIVRPSNWNSVEKYLEELIDDHNY